MTVPSTLAQYQQARDALTAAKQELENAIAALNQFVSGNVGFNDFDADDITPDNAENFLAALDIGAPWDRAKAAKANLTAAEGRFMTALQNAKDQGLI